MQRAHCGRGGNLRFPCELLPSARDEAASLRLPPGEPPRLRQPLFCDLPLMWNVVTLTAERPGPVAQLVFKTSEP